MTYVDKIVERFGGVRAMARAIGKATSTVASWQDRGSIPDAHKRDILQAALAGGIDLAPADFFPLDDEIRGAA